MAGANRMSADGEWWGTRGYWTRAISADGAWRWNGREWSRLEPRDVPDCLEARDPGALTANRRGRMTWRQAVRQAPRLFAAVIFASTLLGAGCAVDVISLVIGLTLGALLAVATLPVLLIFLVIEWGLGVRSEEGRLFKVIDGRQRNLWVAETLVAARGADISRLVGGAYHRVYFSRMTLSFVNYERLGGEALAAAERDAATHPHVRFGGSDTDVSIWASDLSAGALPRICVKSGRPATTQRRFRFVTRGLSFWVLGLLAPGRRAAGPLPLIKPWRLTFDILPALGILTAVAGLVGLLSVGAPRSGRAALVVASFVAIGLSLALWLIYGSLKPKGDVYATEDGTLFVMLRDVNSRFVDAVTATTTDEATVPVSLQS